MDFGRVKTIFIALLLVVDICLGGYYLYDKRQEKESLDRSASNAISFVTEEGIRMNCELPLERANLEPLTLELFSGNGEALSHNDIPVVITGAKGFYVKLAGEGETKKQVDTASKALIKFYQSLSADEKAAGVTVDSVSLVYWLELDENAQAGQRDTAVPAWKFESSLGEYYFRAYTE